MQTHLNESKKNIFAIFVCLIVLMGGMSTDIYLPSLPAITNHFHIDKMFSQLTITSFVLGLGISQFIAGPISDALGRKNLILQALVLQIISLLMVVYAPSIDVLLLFRFVQGVGAGFMLVPARAINNDIFEGSRLKKQVNYMTISFAIGPIIAPFIGGYLQHYYGWQANFLFLLAYGLILLIGVLFFYTETLTSKRRFSLHHIWENYLQILSHRYFVLTAILASLMWGFFGIFNIIAPFIIQTEFHKTSIYYGHIALLMGLGWFLGNMASRFTLHVNKDIKIILSLLGIFTAILIMFGFAMLGYFEISLLIIPTFFILFFGGGLIAILASEALTLFPKLAASANACFFTMVWMMFSLITFLATFLKVNTLVPASISYLVLIILCMIFYSLLKNTTRNSA